MKVLSYDVLARDFRKTWAGIESNGEEVVVTRDRRPVARIVPETQGLSAAEMFGDLHGVLGEAAGATLARKLEGRNGKRRIVVHCANCATDLKLIVLRHP